MADRNTSGSGNSMAFIVGGLVVAVAVIAWFVLSGDTNVADGGDGGGDIDISVSGDTADAVDGASDAIEDAGDAVEDAVDAN